MLNFSAAAGLGFGKGIPQGLEEALRGYASLLDPATYARLVSAAKTLAADPKAALEQIAGGMKTQALSGGNPLDLFEMIERLLQADTIDLNPTSTDQH